MGFYGEPGKGSTLGMLRRSKVAGGPSWLRARFQVDFVKQVQARQPHVTSPNTPGAPKKPFLACPPT